jgi:hypothetical protein
MCAVLQQRVKNTWQPLDFSKKLNPAQQKYRAYARELLTIYETVKQFRHMLEARNFIFTEHKPITYAFQQKRDKCSRQQFDHLHFAAQFTTDMWHISGEDNVVANALSRVESAGQRRRTPKTPGINHRPAARETTNLRYHGLHPLRHACREISTVRSSSPSAPSVPVRP